MQSYPQPLEQLIMQLQKLPGVGPKTAQRLAFFYANTTRHGDQPNRGSNLGS
jgi:recombinational DNA repair protein RecR